MYNPYSNVDFSTTEHIHGISHKHCTVQEQYEYLQSNGIRHLAISNYYPSKPVYPLSDYFTPYEGAIQCPNAEQHNFSNLFGVGVRLHMNSLGSFLETGSERGETPVGMHGLDWRAGIDMILADLQYEDGGGVTINHPVWTGLKAKDCCQILDYDSRVLGIEFYNQSSEESENNGWALDMWDTILRTGRRCFGFSVPDWSLEVIKGRNVLLASPTEYSCLKAYRDGAFYGKVGTTDFKFTNISYNNNVLDVSVDRDAQIKIITDSTNETLSGTQAEKQLNANDYVYVRVEAYSQVDDDNIYSNPIFLNKQGKEIKDDSLNFAIFQTMFLD